MAAFAFPTRQPRAPYLDADASTATPVNGTVPFSGAFTAPADAAVLSSGAHALPTFTPGGSAVPAAPPPSAAAAPPLGGTEPMLPPIGSSRLTRPSPPPALAAPSHVDGSVRSSATRHSAMSTGDATHMATGNPVSTGPVGTSFLGGALTDGTAAKVVLGVAVGALVVRSVAALYRIRHTASSSTAMAGNEAPATTNEQQTAAQLTASSSAPEEAADDRPRSAATETVNAAGEAPSPKSAAGGNDEAWVHVADADPSAALLRGPTVAAVRPRRTAAPPPQTAARLNDDSCRVDDIATQAPIGAASGSRWMMVDPEN